MGLSDALIAVENAANDAAKIEALEDLNQLLVQKINEDESNLNQVFFFLRFTEKTLVIRASAFLTETFLPEFFCGWVGPGLERPLDDPSGH